MKEPNNMEGIDEEDLVVEDEDLDDDFDDVDSDEDLDGISDDSEEE